MDLNNPPKAEVTGSNPVGCATTSALALLPAFLVRTGELASGLTLFLRAALALPRRFLRGLEVQMTFSYGVETTK